MSVADPVTCREMDKVEGPALLSLAARLGTTRLIDNVVVDPGPATATPR